MSLGVEQWHEAMCFCMLNIMDQSLMPKGVTLAAEIIENLEAALDQFREGWLKVWKGNKDDPSRRKVFFLWH